MGCEGGLPGTAEQVKRRHEGEYDTDDKMVQFLGIVIAWHVLMESVMSRSCRRPETGVQWI